jgi:hypothetical protein
MRTFKFIAKWTALLLGTFAGAVLIVGILMYRQFPPACETEVSESVRSPSGVFEAVVFHEWCGPLADSEKISQLAIRQTGVLERPTRDEAIFAVDDYGALPSERYNDVNPRLTLTWNSETELHVGFPKGPRKLKADEQSNGISIRYTQADQ